MNDNAKLTTDQIKEKALAESQGYPPTFYLIQWLNAHRFWSETTFGPGDRHEGIVKHLRKELEEILACQGKDAKEWCDVIILGFDGLWRSHPDSKSEDLIQHLVEKQRINFARAWPDWRTRATNEPIEHVREGEV